MHWSCRSLIALAVWLSVSSAVAKPGLDELVDQLKNSADFRVRVSAALQLGKSLTADATAPLAAALDDANASVRAAAAAALKNLGDQSALPALEAHSADKSDAVRAQVKNALKSLEDERTTGPKPKVLIKIGIMKNVSGVKSTKIENELLVSSRRKLSELPGVRVLGDGSGSGNSGSSGADTKPSNVPMVMVTGNIQELKVLREGRSITYSASVEYILHTMPEQAIAAKVSGRASATGNAQDDAAQLAELRRSVLEAAIASALRRAPPALLAAARL